MKAVVPAGPGKVELTEVTEVEPGPDEMVIEVEAYSVNRGETFQLESQREGWRPGKDVAGVVVRAAADGTGPALGSRVVAHLPHSGWAERAVAPASQVAALPESVGIEQAAAIPLAGLTALRLLRTAGSVTGLRILLTGASGGVGHYFTELAARAGAEITAVVSSPARGARLLELGAAALVHDVRDAREPFDLVLESVGGTSLPAALSKLRPSGTLIWFGQASREPARLNFFDFFDGPDAATIRHFHYDAGIADAPDLATLVRLVATGQLHPELGRVEHWSQTAAVLDDLRDRRVRGNAVLTLRKDTPLMTTTDPKTVVTRYVEAVAAGDLPTIRASFDPDITWTYPGELPLSGVWRGRDTVVDDFLGAVAGKLFAPDAPVTIKLTNAIADGDGDQVFAEWTAQATALSGAAYDNRCSGVFTVRDGRILAVREYLDTDHARRVLFPDHD